MDGLLIVLKYAGSLIAATYGVYATLTDFKEEKEGKKVLSSKGYFGIALLLVSSILALSTAGLKDYKDAKDAVDKAAIDKKNRDDDIKRVETVLAGLTQVKTDLGTQATAIGETQRSMKTSLDLTGQVSNDLGSQLILSRDISLNLGKSAATTQNILRESTESIQFENVVVELAVDPSALRGIHNESLITPEEAKSLTATDLVTPEQFESRNTIARRLQKNSSAVREAVLRDLDVVSWFADDSGEERKDNSQAKDLHYFEAQEQSIQFVIRSFPVGGPSAKDLPGRMYCLVTYQSLPNRFSGIRKFRDLNGLYWDAVVTYDPDIVRPTRVILDVGQMDWFMNSNALVLGLKLTNSKRQVAEPLRFSPSSASQTFGELRIPANFF